MPESPRKRSAPAAKAAQPNDEAVEAKPVKAAKAKAVKADAVKADAAKPAKATKKAKGVPPAQPADLVTPAEPATAGPAKSSTKAAAKDPKKAAAAPVEPPAEVPAAEPETDADQPEFLNRAARRAKGRKGSAAQQVFGTGPTFAGRGAVPGQRQYGTRRTGG